MEPCMTMAYASLPYTIIELLEGKFEVNNMFSFEKSFPNQPASSLLIFSRLGRMRGRFLRSEGRIFDSFAKGESGVITATHCSLRFKRI